jgi:hypothetical protein
MTEQGPTISRIRALAVLLACFALPAAAACSEDSPTTATPPPPSATASSTASPLVTATHTLTGTASDATTSTPTPVIAPPPPDLSDRLLNAIARAVANRDADALVELTAFRLRTCEERPADIGSIACPPGVDDGTLVEVMTTGGCDEGGVLRADEAAAHWRSILDPTAADGSHRGPLEFRALARAGEPRIVGTIYKMLFAYAVPETPERPRRMLSIGDDGILDERAACDYGGPGLSFLELDEIIVEAAD